ASVMPQSCALSSTWLLLIVLPAVGPSSSVSRIPPTLSCTRLPVIVEPVTLWRCSASPQSSSEPTQGEFTTKKSRSLSSSELFAIVRFHFFRSTSSRGSGLVARPRLAHVFLDGYRNRRRRS